jgi:DNA mismatch endonuclease, patch repair protein
VGAFTKQQRSAVMRSIRKTDTQPEIAVRRLLHSLGYRFRLYGKDIPGRPDIVFRSRRKVIFVNGCFWHQHAGCRLARQPKSNLSYWIPKLEGNRRRDQKVRRLLKRVDWSYLTLWECQIRKQNGLDEKLQRYLGK